MEKMQILFPEPQLSRLRDLARRQDRPVSEVVRAAVDSWIGMHYYEGGAVAEEAPVYHCGKVLVDPDSLRDIAYSDRDQS